MLNMHLRDEPNLDPGPGHNLNKLDKGLLNDATYQI